jgi:hypothetical protein
MNRAAYYQALRAAKTIKKNGQTQRRVEAWFRFMKAALRG